MIIRRHLVSEKWNGAMRQLHLLGDHARGINRDASPKKCTPTVSKCHNLSFVYALYETYSRQDIFRNSIIHADNSQSISADCRAT